MSILFDGFPRTIPLPPAAADRSPGRPLADVFSAFDLPQRLLFGQLAAGTFRQSPRGWSARYIGRWSDTSVTASYRRATSQLRIRGTYQGTCVLRESACCDTFADFVLNLATPAPVLFTEPIRSDLEQHYNVQCLDSTAPCDPPADSEQLVQIWSPVPVARLRDLPRLMDTLAGHRDLFADATGMVQLGDSQVMYERGPNEFPFDGAQSGEIHTVRTLGTPLPHLPVHQRGGAGSMWLEIDRRHYGLLLQVHRVDLEAILDCLVEADLLALRADAAGDDFPGSYDYQALVALAPALDEPVEHVDFDGETRILAVVRAQNDLRNIVDRELAPEWTREAFDRQVTLAEAASAEALAACIANEPVAEGV